MLKLTKRQIYATQYIHIYARYPKIKTKKKSANLPIDFINTLWMDIAARRINIFFFSFSLL